MVWEQLELTPPHITFLILPLFLIAYCLFSKLIRNSLHLSEPPLAVIFGIIFGPVALNVLRPREWGINDEILQEITRVIVAIQCFAVGIELPKHYFYRHWSSVLYFLGPIMTFSCGITALFAYFIFKTTFASALIIGACLSPTDPVLAASVLSNSRFSSRVPKRLRNMLSAESASNDGVSFPFLYAGIYALKFATPKEALKEWVLITVLWQCVFGISIGLIIGNIANRILRFTTSKKYVSESSFVVFYLLLALLSVGVGSTLGSGMYYVKTLLKYELTIMQMIFSWHLVQVLASATTDGSQRNRERCHSQPLLKWFSIPPCSSYSAASFLGVNSHPELSHHTSVFGNCHSS